MNIEEAREHYSYFSATQSEVNRKLCFAGVAVVWVFAFESSSGGPALPASLFFPLRCFVFGLCFDLLHYMVASASWGIFNRLKEKAALLKGEELLDQDLEVPMQINWAPIFFFWSKSAATLVGYFALLHFFWNLSP